MTNITATCEWGECSWTGAVEAVTYPDGSVHQFCDQCAREARAYVEHLQHEAVVNHTGDDVLDAAGNNLSEYLRDVQARWLIVQNAANAQERILRQRENDALASDTLEASAQADIAAVTYQALADRADALRREWVGIEAQIADTLGVED